MADVKLNFIHPSDGRVLTVTLDDTMSAQETVAELISNDFVSPNPQGYNLAVKGGSLLQPNQTFNEAGIKNDTSIRVIPATDAGNK